MATGQASCAADPARNPHLTGVEWGWTTVATILANPRYTGRQVWNRQHHEYADPVVDDLIGQAPAGADMSPGPSHAGDLAAEGRQLIQTQATQARSMI
jgi:hypothetical protein